MNFHNISFKACNFTVIVLGTSQLVVVVDLGMSFGKVKVWK